MPNAADAVTQAGTTNPTDEQPPAMVPTLEQQQRANNPGGAAKAVTEASPQQPEQPTFMDRAIRSLAAPFETVGKQAADVPVPPVLQGVMPPPQDREAANQGFTEGFRRLGGIFTAGGAGAPPEVGGMGDLSTSQQLQAQNAQKAAEYNQRFGNDPDAQKGLMTAQALIGLPAAIGAPYLAGAAARAIPLVSRIAPYLEGSAGADTGGVAGLLSRGAGRAASGAIGGGAAGAVTADPSQGFGKQVYDAAVQGGLLTPTIGAATDLPIEAANRLRGAYVGGRLPDGSLPAAVAQRANAADILQRNGVPVTGAQVGQDPLSSGVATYGGKAPFSGARPFGALQDQKFRGGALGIMGDPDGNTLATNKVMQDNRDRIGHLFDGAKGTDIPVANLGALGQVGNDLRLAPPSATSDLRPVLGDIMQTIQRNGGVMPGNFYQTYVQSGSALQKIAASDSQAAPYAQQIIDALHDGMQKTTLGTPVYDDIKAGRQQTRAWYAINDAARGSGDGTFNADQLHTATTGQQQRFSNTRGVLDDFSDAGKTILGTPAARTAAASAVGTGAGMGAGMRLLGAIGPGVATAGATAGMLANTPLQALIRASGPRAIQTLQAGGGVPISPTVLALQRALPALLATGRPQNFGGQQP